MPGIKQIVVIAAIALAVIYAANNVPMVSNLVGPKAA